MVMSHVCLSRCCVSNSLSGKCATLSSCYVMFPRVPWFVFEYNVSQARIIYSYYFDDKYNTKEGVSLLCVTYSGPRPFGLAHRSTKELGY